MVDKRRKAGNGFSKILEAKNQKEFRNSAVQGLGLSTSLLRAEVQSLVAERKSLRLHGVVKKTKKQKTQISKI